MREQIYAAESDGEPASGGFGGRREGRKVDGSALEKKGRRRGGTGERFGGTMKGGLERKGRTRGLGKRGRIGLRGLGRRV